MRNPQFAEYTDQEVSDAHLWLKNKITEGVLAGRDVEKYRTPFSEVATEVNVRINDMLDEIESVLNS